jgi:hypothetical protein
MTRVAARIVLLETRRIASPFPPGAEQKHYIPLRIVGLGKSFTNSEKVGTLDTQVLGGGVLKWR